MSLALFGLGSNKTNSQEWMKETSIDKQGWLNKKSRMVKQARKRWIVVKGAWLLSYKNTNTKRKPTETFDLRTYSQIKVINETTFELLAKDTSPSRIFIADSSQDVIEWIKAIGNAQKKCVCSIQHSVSIIS